MTSREARTLRRAAERKAAKLENKLSRSSDRTTISDSKSAPQDELARALQMEANLLRDRIHREAAPKPADGFISQNRSRAEINRQNALNSTGPCTPAGKLASSGNSLKHGLASGKMIIPGEDPAGFEALLRDLLDEHQPANTTEELLVNEMTQSYWLAQRAIRFQNECFSAEGVDEKRLSLFLRYQTTHDRNFHKVLNALMKLKKERGRGFVSQAVVGSAQFVRQFAHKPSEIGFVSQEAPKDAASASGFSEMDLTGTPQLAAKAA